MVIESQLLNTMNDYPHNHSMLLAMMLCIAFGYPYNHTAVGQVPLQLLQRNCFRIDLCAACFAYSMAHSILSILIIHWCLEVIWEQRTYYWTHWWWGSSYTWWTLHAHSVNVQLPWKKILVRYLQPYSFLFPIKSLPDCVRALNIIHEVVMCNKELSIYLVTVRHNETKNFMYKVSIS